MLPVSKRGFVFKFGFGIYKLPIKVAEISEINLTLEIVAWAPLVWPTRIISGDTNPENPPSGWFEREKVSILIIVDVDEYEEGIIICCVLYGFDVNTVDGELYTPSLWFDCATLKVIFGSITLGSKGDVPVDLVLPVTVSPTLKTPEIICISSNFGTQYLVTFVPSKKA